MKVCCHVLVDERLPILLWLLCCHDAILEGL
jgi:hypothetical protein